MKLRYLNSSDEDIFFKKRQDQREHSKYCFQYKRKDKLDIGKSVFENIFFSCKSSFGYLMAENEDIQIKLIKILQKEHNKQCFQYQRKVKLEIIFTVFPCQDTTLFNVTPPSSNIDRSTTLKHRLYFDQLIILFYDGYGTFYNPVLTLYLSIMQRQNN